jgi:parallel beta-helix repeat protein
MNMFLPPDGLSIGGGQVKCHLHQLRRIGIATAVAGLAAVSPPCIFAGASAAYGQAEETPLTNPNGTCLELRGVKDRVIENRVIGPCGGNGIELWDSQNITIRNVVITDTAASGIYIHGSTSIAISESRISNTISGIYAISSSGIKVGCNTIEDPRGPVPRGQFVQFDKVSGGENAISCNVGRNRPGRGTPEDAISLYKSNGAIEKPIEVSYNLIIGGGPSNSGGGIMMGDDGGSHQLAKGNILIDPGQYGIGVASGNNMSIADNLVFGRKQDFTNVGIYVWNQYPHPCHTISVTGNSVKWQSKTGRPNPFWSGKNCSNVSGLLHNNFKADLSPAIADAQPPQECGCQTQGRHR